MKKALVLGGGPQVFLSVVRSLGRGGVEVHVAWTEPECISRRSRYIFKAHAIPAFEPGNPAWKPALMELMRTEQFDLVLPCTEREFIACQRQREDLERYGRVYLPNEQSCDVLFDKIKTSALARSVGVPMPRELIACRGEQIDDILAQFDYPVVLKPRRSLDPVNPGPFLQVRKAGSERALRDLLPEMLRQGD